LPEVNAMGNVRLWQFFHRPASMCNGLTHPLDLQGSFTIGVWVAASFAQLWLDDAGEAADENHEFHLKLNGTVNWWWQTSSPATS
jgi:hypothetical protein